jgi:hypothetical protein
MVEKDITLLGFNLGGSLHHVPQALGLFRSVARFTNFYY